MTERTIKIESMAASPHQNDQSQEMDDTFDEGSGGPVSNRNFKHYFVKQKENSTKKMDYDYHCKLCPEGPGCVFPGPRIIFSHLREVHKICFEFYECIHCDYATRFKFNLDRHVAKYHPRGSKVQAPQNSASNNQKNEVTTPTPTNDKTAATVAPPQMPAQQAPNPNPLRYSIAFVTAPIYDPDYARKRTLTPDHAPDKQKERARSLSLANRYFPIQPKLDFQRTVQLPAQLPVQINDATGSPSAVQGSGDASQQQATDLAKSRRSIGREEAASPAQVNQPQKQAQTDEKPARADSESSRSKDGYSLRHSRKMVSYDESSEKQEQEDQDMAAEAAGSSGNTAQSSSNNEKADQNGEQMVIEQNNENENEPPSNEASKISAPKPTSSILGAIDNQNQNPPSVLDFIKQFGNSTSAKTTVPPVMFYKDKERSVSSIVEFIRKSDQQQHAPAVVNANANASPAACSSQSNGNSSSYQVGPANKTQNAPVKRPGATDTSVPAPKPSLNSIISKLSQHGGAPVQTMTYSGSDTLAVPKPSLNSNNVPKMFSQNCAAFQAHYSDSDSNSNDQIMPAEPLSILQEIGNDYNALRLKHRELVQSRVMMDKYEKKMENVDAHIANMDTRLTQFEGRLYKIDEKLEKVMKFIQNCS